MSNARLSALFDQAATVFQAIADELNDSTSPAPEESATTLQPPKEEAPELTDIDRARARASLRRLGIDL